MSLKELNAERSVYYPSAAVRQQQGQEELARNRLAELTGQPASIYEGQSLEKLNAEILKQSEPKPKENLFGDSVQAQAAQKLIDAGADPVEVAERILEGKPTTQVIEMPVDKTDPLQGTKQVLLNKNTLEMQDIPGSVVLPSKKDIPAADARLYNKFQVTFDQINQSIALLSDEDAVKGVGFFPGNAPSLMIPAKAKELRALLADLTTDRLNEKFGAALTKQEYDRIKPAVPLETDSEETLQVKLNTLKNIFRNKMGLLEQQYPSNRFRPFPNIDAIGLKGYNEAMGN